MRRTSSCAGIIGRDGVCDLFLYSQGVRLKGPAKHDIISGHMMTVRSKIIRWWVGVLTCGLLGIGAVSIGGERGLPAQQGILNFGKISNALYRGAQPDTAAVSNLKRLGIRSIIDLRMPKEVRKAEAAEALSCGILYTNLPLHGLRGPTDEQVRTVLSLIETLEGPVFIHCQHGCDRTGTIIACYRIKHDNWSHQSALEEAVRHGLSVFERGMRKYVLAFANARSAVAKK